MGTPGHVKYFFTKKAPPFGGANLLALWHLACAVVERVRLGYKLISPKGFQLVNLCEQRILLKAQILSHLRGSGGDAIQKGQVANLRIMREDIHQVRDIAENFGGV
jgi:hypothetical protein